MPCSCHGVLSVVEVVEGGGERGAADALEKVATCAQISGCILAGYFASMRIRIWIGCLLSSKWVPVIREMRARTWHDCECFPALATRDAISSIPLRKILLSQVLESRRRTVGASETQKNNVCSVRCVTVVNV